MSRCNPGRRVVLVGHGQRAHLGLAATALDPTVADELERSMSGRAVA